MQYYSSNQKRIYRYKRFKQKKKLTEEQKLNQIKVQLRKSKDMYEWRKKILKRDNYTCQLCGKQSKKGKIVFLQVHHIVRFSDDVENGNIENVFSLMNGITLCSHCHNEINGKEELFEDYFKNIAIRNSKKHY